MIDCIAVNQRTLIKCFYATENNIKHRGEKTNYGMP